MDVRWVVVFCLGGIFRFFGGLFFLLFLRDRGVGGVVLVVV